MSPSSPTPTPSPSPSPGRDAGSSDRSPETSRRSREASSRPSETTSGSAPRSPASSSPASPSPASSISAPPPRPLIAPETSSGPPRSGRPAPDPVTTAAVQTALGAEYAAIWCYGLVQAFLPDTLEQRAQEDLTAHRARRDLTVRLLADYSVTPVAAEPAYRTPAPVTELTSAMRLAVAAEADAAAAWRSVLERCDDQGLRGMALDGLSDAAVRGARWSQQLGVAPAVPAFPGQA